MIEVRSLSHFYGERCAVSDVTFSIASNEVVGFLGLNGAGKSTTLKILGGVLIPTLGDVRIDGVDMAEAPLEIRSRIGFLPEEPPLYLEMTVSDYVGYVGLLNGMKRSDLPSRVAEVLEKCQLKGHEQRVIGELSHGFKKRVGIAQAIVHRPRLVILDEPISGLDPVQIVEMRKVIVGLKAESTVLVSSHILSEVSETCDRLLVMKKGKIVAQGTESQLRSAMRGGGQVEMRIRGTVDAVKAVLAARKEVANFTVQAHPEGLVDAVIALADDRREDLVAALVGAGLGVRRVDDAKNELEEIFLRLNQEDAA